MSSDKKSLRTVQTWTVSVQQHSTHTENVHAATRRPIIDTTVLVDHIVAEPEGGEVVVVSAGDADGPAEDDVDSSAVVTEGLPVPVEPSPQQTGTNRGLYVEQSGSFWIDPTPILDRIFVRGKNFIPKKALLTAPDVVACGNKDTRHRRNFLVHHSTIHKRLPLNQNNIMQANSNGGFYTNGKSYDLTKNESL
jgi:hypothetical protein